MDNDRLQSITNQNGTINFTYDLKGQKVRSDDGTQVTNYLIDHRLPYGQVLAEYRDGLISDAVHTYGLERISQDRGGSVNFYFSDGQMSVRNLTDASSNITDSYSYYGFGDALSSSGATANSFRYVGEELNGYTNLYNLRARWYNQENGRFTSVDPFRGDVLSPFSLHRYLYANQSPISNRDPTGEFTLVEAMVTVSVVGILAAVAIPKFFQVEVNAITMKRINPHKNQHGEKDYGHWWTELMGGESYGWWPDRRVTNWETLTGVPGDLNGQKEFRGSPTRDPYHGFKGEIEFHPKITPWGKVKTVPDAMRCIRNFARNFNGQWSWPLGPNCQTFQKDMMKACELEKP